MSKSRLQKSKSKLQKIKLYYEVQHTIKEIKMDLKKRTIS